MKFFKKVSLVIFVLMIVLNSAFSVIIYAGENNSQKETERILTLSKLKPGDKVCILAPVCTTENLKKIREKRLDTIVNNIEEYGFKVVVYRESLEVSKFGNDTAQLRADLFNKAIKDSEIKMLVLFSGYGSMQILDKIDYKEVKKNPKIIVTLGDTGVISSAIFAKAGMVTFYGPLLSSQYSLNETLCFDNLFDVLMNPKEQFEITNIDDNTPFKVFKSGDCEGQIFGDTLSL